MTTSYTTLLGFALPVTGELQGTWGDITNNSITQLCEDAIAGVATASVTSADWTLTTTGSGATNQARMAILIPTGSPGVSRNIIAPSKSKTYTIINQSNAAVVIKGAATTGVTITAGDTVVVAWSGSDFVAVKYTNGVFNNLTVSGNASVTGTLGVTGASTLGDLLASGTVSGVGFTNYLKTPPAIGGTTAAAGTFTDLTGTSIGAGAAATSSTFVNIGAGTTSKSASVMASGTLLTTPVAGATEFDGSNTYFTNDTVSGRGVIAPFQIYKLTSNASAIGPTIADFFPSPSTITLAANGYYQFEYVCYLTKTGSTGSLTLTLTSDQTWSSLDLTAQYMSGAVLACFGSNPVNNNSSNSVVFGGQSIASGATAYIRVVGTIHTTSVNQTLRLRASLTTGTLIPLAGSYYTIRRIPSSNVGTFVA